VIRGIHHVGLHTPDLDRLRRFYEEAFGLEAVGGEFHLEDFPTAPTITGVPGATARVVMLKGPNCFVEMFEWADPMGDPSAARDPRDLGYTHFAVDVEDIDAEFERLSALGMTFVHSRPVRTGGSASVYGRDPDGNIIELVEIPGDDAMHLAAPGGPPS
jgi:glyoxylase I family protein